MAAPKKKKAAKKKSQKLTFSEDVPDHRDWKKAYYKLRKKIGAKAFKKAGYKLMDFAPEKAQKRQAKKRSLITGKSKAGQFDHGDANEQDRRRARAKKTAWKKAIEKDRKTKRAKQSWKKAKQRSRAQSSSSSTKVTWDGDN